MSLMKTTNNRTKQVPIRINAAGGPSSRLRSPSGVLPAPLPPVSDQRGRLEAYNACANHCRSLLVTPFSPESPAAPRLAFNLNFRYRGFVRHDNFMGRSKVNLYLRMRRVP